MTMARGVCDAVAYMLLAVPKDTLIDRLAYCISINNI